MSERLRVVAMHADSVVPAYKSAGAAGMDLSAWLDGGTLTLEVGSIAVVPLGIRMEIPLGYEGQVRPRSGLASRHGVTVVNAPGTIDSDYRGELMVPLINLGREVFVIEHGMRVAQLIIASVAHVQIERAKSLEATERGEAGFGSTGLSS